MSRTVHISESPLVPLSASEIDNIVQGEMRRRAWKKACADYMVEHPGETTWFINDDACATLKTWEHD